MSLINAVGHNYNNPDAWVKKQFQIRDERIDALEQKISSLLNEKQGVILAMAKTKDLDELKLQELKVLCDEYGIDYNGFGNAKQPYIEALKVKGL